MQYSKKVIKYFRNLKHMGRIKGASIIEKIGNPVCGDILKLYLKIRKNKNKKEFIKDIKVLTTGCVAAIASSSVLCEIVKGKTLKKAKKITKSDILKKLDGLPKHKIHCSLLAIDALHNAIKNYEKKKKR